MKTAKIFQNGQSQAVRLPREFRLKGREVYIKRTGNAIVLLPITDNWNTLLDSLDSFSKDFMSERNQPMEQQRRENLFP